MSDGQALSALVRGNLNSMKELQGLLKRRGIRSEVRRPPDKDGKSG